MENGNIGISMKIVEVNDKGCKISGSFGGLGGGKDCIYNEFILINDYSYGVKSKMKNSRSMVIKPKPRLGHFI